MKYREDRRKKAFHDNLEKIREVNEKYEKGACSFKCSTNDLADLSNEVYLRQFVRLTKSDFEEDNEHTFLLGNSLFGGKTYPETLDWREKGFITKPMNQKSCGSCYAYSIAHSVEGQLFKRLNRIIQLSPQQIVDCSSSFGNHGCTHKKFNLLQYLIYSSLGAGGALRTSLRYLESCGGLMREVDYPYTATVNFKFIHKKKLYIYILYIKFQHNKCSFDKDLAIVNITTWNVLPPKNEEIMKAVLNEVGPIAVSINASLKTFQLYSEGIYDDPDCSTTLNHAMLLIGYGKDYWIVKNWWGSRWGEGKKNSICIFF